MRARLAVLVAVAVIVSCDEHLAPTPLPGECVTAPLVDDPRSPLDAGRRALAAALGERAQHIDVSVIDGPSAKALEDAHRTLDARPESFAVLPDVGGRTKIVGRDEVGAMYGAFEVAERLGAGEALPASGISAAPRVRVRGYNAYVVLPERAEQCWYFVDPTFWRDYLDSLARSRIDFLDLHAMYDVETTLSPNPLLWFGVSASFPDVGRPLEERRRNQRMLATIVEMARVRGIRVGFLAARADLEPSPKLTTDRSTAGLSENDLVRYTQEAVADLIEHVPGLARLGARIGEGAQLPAGASPEAQALWYRDAYLPALTSHPDGPRFYTRSWLSRRAAADQLLSSPGASDSWLEVKFAAEQFGTPYPPQNGSFAGGPADWRPSYTYEDYLDGPAPPYSVVFQLWLSATYRFFRFASYARAKRAVESMLTFGDRVAGFSIQAGHTYGSQRDYWHADRADAYSPWTFARDELEPWLFGRLGYDPETPEARLRARLRERTGAEPLWDAEQAGSDLVALIVAAHSCGPDSRDFAPQLEWLGPVSVWASAATIPPGAPSGTCVDAYHGPLDAFGFAGPEETAAGMLSGTPTAKVSSLTVARRVLDDAAAAHAARGVSVDAENAWARDVARECEALGDLGDYFGHKLRAATMAALYTKTASPRFLEAARAEAALGVEGWRRLAADTAYVRAFADPYRMNRIVGKGEFHFRDELPMVEGDVADLDALDARVRASPPGGPDNLPPISSWLDGATPPLVQLRNVAAIDGNGACAMTADLAPALDAGTGATLWWKPVAADRDWANIPATVSASRGGVSANVPTGCAEALVAVEVRPPGAAPFRLPHPLLATPYVRLRP